MAGRMRHVWSFRFSTVCGPLTMFSTNQANWDRILRIAIGIGMLTSGGLGLLPEPWSLTVIVLSFYPFITGASGWCPVYVLFEHRTNRRRSPR